MLPREGSPSPSERIQAWTRSSRFTKQLLGVLRRLAEGDGDSSGAARRALRISNDGEHPLALERYFVGADLEARAGAPSYRKDAYARLLLWFDAVSEMEACAGPVLIIDEAENLYRGGIGRSERRTALRSLAFYCGGALPRACVVLAITPEALRELKGESNELLGELEEQKTVLPWEEGEMLRRRLRKTQPIEVPPLTRPMRALLAGKLRESHAEVRGRVTDRGWGEYVNALVRDEPNPRAFVRSLVDRLERAAFTR
jgi:hypothetical protein